LVVEQPLALFEVEEIVARSGHAGRAGAAGVMSVADESDLF
jgi:hypothetical protein